MKQFVLFLFGMYLTLNNVFAQSTTTGNVWGTNRFLGWQGNNALEFRTAGVNRMKLNESISYTINGSNDVRAGYLLIGRDMPLWGGGPNELYSTAGAFSLLHLSGGSGTFAQPNGHRSWMKTGVTFTDNNDMTYIGLRQIGTGNDITETNPNSIVMGWIKDNICQ